MKIEDIIRVAQEAGWDAHHAEFDTRIQTFATLVIANHPPQSYMTWQEGYEAGKQAERARLQAFMRQMFDAYALPSTSAGLRKELNQE